MLIELGQRDADPKERLLQVARSADRAKAQARKMSKEGLMDLIFVAGSALDMGLLAARGAMPDIDLLVERMRYRFDELARSYRVGNARTKAAPRKKRAKV